jgi:tRNA(fMet)-specific endonuclease VapC
VLTQFIYLLLNCRVGYERILTRIDGLAYEQVVISTIELAELRYGIAKSVKKEANRTKLYFFLHQFECLPFEAEATACYGEIRTQPEAKGTPIEPLDILIAAHALSLTATIVTNNVREFERIEGLTIENWIAKDSTTSYG